MVLSWRVCHIYRQTLWNLNFSLPFWVKFWSFWAWCDSWIEVGKGLVLAMITSFAVISVQRSSVIVDSSRFWFIVSSCTLKYYCLVQFSKIWHVVKWDVFQNLVGKGPVLYCKGAERACNREWTGEQRKLKVPLAEHKSAVEICEWRGGEQ
jgi:hypothetical protein